MSVVSKYKKDAYFATVIPVLMTFSCFASFYLFTGSLIGDGFVRTSFWLSFMLLFLSIMFGWFAVLAFKLYSRKVIDGNELRYYIPYLPFLVFYRDIDAYESKYRVRTFNRYGEIINGIWLIRKGKVRYEMYSDTFSNLYELGKTIKLPEYVIKKPVPPFTLAAYQLGLKRVNTE